jgi:hypothetical protein
MFKAIYILLFTLLLTISSWVGASYEYAVIPTQQKADDIIKQLKPLFVDNAKFSAKGYQLIIKASPNIINEIKYILKKIDRPLQNLIISIATNKNIDRLLKSSYVSGQLTSREKTQQINSSDSDHSKSSIGQDIAKPSGGRSKITSTRRFSDKQQNGIYSARVIEGNWVYIYTGKQLAYYSNPSSPNIYPYNYQIPQTQFKEIKSGFEAKATLQTGNRVLIQIKAQNNQQNKNYQRNINSSSTESTLSGTLNEWIQIGKISNNKAVNNRQNTQQSFSGVQYQSRPNETQETFYIKINTTN